MPFCGSIVVVTDPVSGATYNTVAITPTVSGDSPPVITDPATCAVVLDSGADYSGWKQLMSLSPDDAQVISIHIGIVWAIAWGFRAVRSAIFDPTERYDQ